MAKAKNSGDSVEIKVRKSPVKKTKVSEAIETTARRVDSNLPATTPNQRPSYNPMGKIADAISWAKEKFGIGKKAAESSERGIAARGSVPAVRESAGAAARGNLPDIRQNREIPRSNASKVAGSSVGTKLAGGVAIADMTTDIVSGAERDKQARKPENNRSTSYTTPKRTEISAPRKTTPIEKAPTADEISAAKKNLARVTGSSPDSIQPTKSSSTPEASNVSADAMPAAKQAAKKSAKKYISKPSTMKKIDNQGTTKEDQKAFDNRIAELEYAELDKKYKDASKRYNEISKPSKPDPIGYRELDQNMA